MPSIWASPRGNVLSVSLEATISGHRNWSQLSRKVSRARAPSAGLQLGRMMRQKIPRSLQPSSRAASISESGRSLMYWRMKDAEGVHRERHDQAAVAVDKSQPADHQEGRHEDD